MGKLSQSYVHGASQLPLIGDTIGVHLDHIAARAPERPALIVRQQRTRWSYAEFQRRAEELAAGLIALGFKPGDRLGIWSPNNAEWVLLQFATAKAGIILVNINPAYRLHELEYALNTVGCLGVIVAPVFKTSDYIAMVRSLCPELGLSPPSASAPRNPPAC
jgi:fatty-acyl-CoA synthase